MTNLSEGNYIIKLLPFSHNIEMFIVTSIYKREVEGFVDYLIFVESTFSFKDQFFKGRLDFDYRKLEHREVEEIVNIHRRLQEIWRT